MKAWRQLWDAGKLAIVENCGYPQPNRSHFESRDIWHAGQVGSPSISGWLGRAADRSSAGDLCYVGPGAIPHAVSRRQRTVTALERLGDLRLRRDAVDVAGLATSDVLAATIGQRLDMAKQLSSGLPQSGLSDLLPAEQNNNRRALAERLNVIRTMLEKDQPYRVYYTVQDGFDTHANQSYTHQSLLENVSNSVASFLDSLAKQQLDQGVTVFLFSEFGRRVRENGSQGTDHGAAAPVFVLGNHVKGGIQGGVPNLTDLDQDDLKFAVDFRDVYAAILRDGLAVDPTGALGPRDATLSLFRT
jgi:uncharacterized protein (DUF1501 family)